jgi:hypothetical protein
LRRVLIESFGVSISIEELCNCTVFVLGKVSWTCVLVYQTRHRRLQTAVTNTNVPWSGLKVQQLLCALADEAAWLVMNIYCDELFNKLHKFHTSYIP